MNLKLLLRHKYSNILLVFLMLCVYYIGFNVPLSGDAVRYASISQEMLKSGNFIELQNRGGIPYLQKPPLLFWITYISFKLFGISEISFKLPVFLIALAFLLNMFLTPLSFEYNAMYQACKIVNAKADGHTKFIMAGAFSDGYSDDTFNFYLEPGPEFVNDFEEIENFREGWIFTDTHIYNTYIKHNCNISEIYKLQHLKSMRPGFLSPKSRNNFLHTRYLVYINNNIKR